jgi:distribution and morphology protein 31
VFAIANSLRLQGPFSFDGVIYFGLIFIKSEYVARALSDYLTAETGSKIIFESAIVPKWKDSRISFKNVYVVRRPTDC